MDIDSEDELQDTDFSEDDNECHDPKQSSKAPVKGSLKVSDWVVVKCDWSLAPPQNDLKRCSNLDDAGLGCIGWYFFKKLFIVVNDAIMAPSCILEYLFIVQILVFVPF